MKTIRDLLIEEVRDTYSSETQILEGLGAMAEAATSPNLKQAFQTHRQETQNQVERLKRAFEHLGADPEGNTCEATQGLIAEAEEVMDEGLPGELLDVALVMAAHYEIASYGSLKTIAQDCGESEVAALLGQTLEEEKATDEKLTRLAETEINKRAIAASPSA
jgi:ferritin-like metal-binding protein YciE